MDCIAYGDIIALASSEEGGGALEGTGLLERMRRTAEARRRANAQAV